MTLLDAAGMTPRVNELVSATMRQLKITKQVTNRETASLDKYLQEIGRVDLVTAEEEVELAQKIKVFYFYLLLLESYYHHIC